MNEYIMNNLLDAAADETVTTTETTEVADGSVTPTEPQEASWGSSISSILIMVVMVVVFYFLLIRPQRKKDKAVKNMLDSLKVGDRICTIGGFYGTIVRIKDDVLTIECGEAKTQMMIARWAVKNVDTLSITNDSETLI